MNKKLNVLITGANGFVGRALMEKLSHKVNLFLVSRNTDFVFEGTKIFYGDLADESFSREIVKDIDVVYYLAGYKKNIAFHVKYLNDFIVGNVEPLTSFLKAAQNSSIKKIIYLSSVNVGLYKDEEEDGYVIGKYINELTLKSFARQSDIDIKIVRSAPIYGPGDNFNPETANFIPTMISKVYESSNDISVWGHGLRGLQFIFIDDLVSNLIAISESTEDLFLVGNSKIMTINEIVEKVIKLSNKSLKIINDTSKPDKLTQLFNFNNEVSPKVNFDDGLKKTLDYYKGIKNR